MPDPGLRLEGSELLQAVVGLSVAWGVQLLVVFRIVMPHVRQIVRRILGLPLC